MEPRTVVCSTLLCVVVIVAGTHASPFFFPEPDCYSAAETPYDGGYQEPDYQQTLQDILRALQEIVFLTVRAAKEELTQLSKLWLPACDPGDSADGEDLPEVTLEEVLEVTTHENSSGGETTTLGNRVGNESSSSSSFSNVTITNGTRKNVTSHSNTVTTQAQAVGILNISSSKEKLNPNLPSKAVDMEHTTQDVTEEITTETVTIPNEILE